ncbi:MAG: hypothetical protein JEZ14_23700 [Marinilabiliaceae bacterium]|nr:hypothetical protein [Marinilabiliaceae bacterium]
MKRTVSSFFIAMMVITGFGQSTSQLMSAEYAETKYNDQTFPIENVFLFIEDTLVNGAVEVNHTLILTSSEATVDKKTKLIHGNGSYLKFILSPEHNCVTNEYGLAPLTPTKSFAFGEYLSASPSLPISIFQSGKLILTEKDNLISLKLDGHLLSPNANQAMYLMSKYHGKCEQIIALDGK